MLYTDAGRKIGVPKAAQPEGMLPQKKFKFRAFPYLFCSQDIFSTKLIRFSSVVSEVQCLRGKKDSDAIGITE